MAGIWLVRERAWLDLVFLLIAFVGSQLAVSLLKDGFDRARPDVGSAVPLPESSSFPSGHAAAGRRQRSAPSPFSSPSGSPSRRGGGVGHGAVVLAVASGRYRIALNVHYVTDVLAGWCFGLAWLAACLLLREAIRVRAGWGRFDAPPGTIGAWPRRRRASTNGSSRSGPARRGVRDYL